MGGAKYNFRWYNMITKSSKRRAIERRNKSCVFYFSYCTETDHFATMVSLLEHRLFQDSPVALVVFRFQKFHLIRFIGTIELHPLKGKRSQDIIMWIAHAQNTCVSMHAKMIIIL